jgi:hypothetical protein
MSTAAGVWVCGQHVKYVQLHVPCLLLLRLLLHRHAITFRAMTAAAQPADMEVGGKLMAVLECCNCRHAWLHAC